MPLDWERAARPPLPSLPPPLPEPEVPTSPPFPSSQGTHSISACLELTWSSFRQSPERPCLTRPTVNFLVEPSATKTRGSEEPGTEQVSSRRAGKVEEGEAAVDAAAEAVAAGFLLLFTVFVGLSEAAEAAFLRC